MKARRGKNAPFWHHSNGGRGGPDVPFILSKIAVCVVGVKREGGEGDSGSTKRDQRGMEGKFALLAPPSPCTTNICTRAR